jgi:hypothetical protein
MTNEELIVMLAEKLFEHEKKTMGVAWYHPSETYKGLGAEPRKHWLASAQAVIEALAPMMREVSSSLQEAIAFADWQPNKWEKALASLPECWKGEV